MRLQLPPPVPERTPTPFPWMGALAPVIAAALLFAITRSPLSLAFAALGPLMAVASMVDGTRQARRARRTASERRSEALAALSVELAARHARLRRRLADSAPSARELLAAGARRSVAPEGGPAAVRLGTGSVPSGIDLQPLDPDDRAIATAAAELHDAPVLVDARGGVGVIGAPALTAVFARTLTVQLDVLGSDDLDPGATGRRASSSGPILRADSLAALPQRTAVVVEVRGLRDAVLRRSPEGMDGLSFVPEMLSAAEASALPTVAASEALPARVDLVEVCRGGLLAGDAGGDSRGGDDHEERGKHLVARFAVTADGPLPIDLVADGPHALVGGTTGSGKSELLLAWLVALADCYSPTELELLLFDFKGGASFDQVAALPHVRGLVTDLDGVAIDRAAASLAAEMRRREDALRARAARSIEECSDLGRLVVVVDEFAALLGNRGELHDVFADIAARGRSLGMHLILATQRPTGVMRDSLLANCGLRISLRVVSPADSTAVVGTAAAARISRSLPGRGLVALHGEPPLAVQVATAGKTPLSELVGRLSRLHDRPRTGSGFLPPLPPVIPLAGLLRDVADGGEGSVTLGRSDLPGEGRQPIASWRPGRHGALLVSGAPGSGRSEAARVIASQLRVPVIEGSAAASGESFWDALRSGGPFVVDDLDTLLDALPDEHLAEVPALLAAAIRSSGRRVAVTAGSPSAAAVRPLLAALNARLALRSASRDEHLLNGADISLHDPRLPPGGGVWDGARVQVASGAQPLPPSPAQVERVDPAALSAATPLLIVSTRAARRAEQLEAAGVHVTALPATDPSPRSWPYPAPGSSAMAAVSQSPAAPASAVLLGDPDGWQASVALWPRLGAETVVYDGCSVSQFRLVSRRRQLPPVLASIDGRVWITRPGDPTERGEILWDQL